MSIQEHVVLCEITFTVTYICDEIYYYKAKQSMWSVSVLTFFYKLDESWFVHENIYMQIAHKN